MWRNGLWYKLIANGIQGKYLIILKKNMYMMIKMNGMTTDFFTCNIGVGQSENFSPFFFSHFTLMIYKKKVF